MKQTCSVCGLSKSETISIKTHKDELILDSNGKRLWKVYVEDGTITFNGTFEGSGYFGVQVLDNNQNLEELVVNEVGSYVLQNKRVYVGTGWHYIQLEVTNGSYSVSWAGTGGH